MRILLTGFEPFGDQAQNPTAQIAEELVGCTIGGSSAAGTPAQSATIVSAVLPVEFAAVGLALEHLLQTHQPELVLSLGLAAGTQALRFERVAINLIDARIPDNAGAQPVDVPVLPGAPNAYFTTLPVKAMAAAARPVAATTLSYSAGSYVCNALMFHALHATSVSAVRAGFLHVPTADVIPVKTVSAAVVSALEAALTTLSDVAEPGGSIY
ncbi:pyroglutamyl-peptidase I family protein [Micrococcoides hystricis]|uniref:Pyrrolidone-carboxylate peptidase n=1 Tax=Micrococcoides hystricis TaxID=1572761 RepID=A0ABV6PD27_9MICC